MIDALTKHLLEFIKLSPRYLVALGGAAAFLLFGPEAILKVLSVFEFAQNYRPWLGIILILASALMVVTLTIKFTDGVKTWWEKRKFYLRMKERLHCLTEDEKQILRFYIAEQTKSNVLRFDDGVVQGLASAGIIYQGADVGNLIEGFSYNISEFAWNHLNVNPSLLEGTTNTYRTDRKQYWR